MSKKINKVEQFIKLDDKDKKWYSSIKEKINDLEQGYGSISITIKVKSGQVVGLEFISKSSENLG